MRKLVALSLALALTACGGGYDDMDAARLAGSGIGSTVTKLSEPSTPNTETRWKYSSTDDGDRAFSLRANNYALNFFYNPTFPTIKYSPWVELEKRLTFDNSVTETVTIFVNSTLSCSPSCDVRMSFDGQWGTYRMRNSTDGIIKPIDENTEATLFKKFTSSNKATVSLPIIGLPEPFGANFDLHGYDMKKMKF